MSYKIYILTLFFISACKCEDEPLVVTPLGKIQGFVGISGNGRKYSAFEGIPYAKPPLGDKRFEEPEAVEPWTGVWKANFRTECAQTSIQKGATLRPGTDEDCLHINVYVPREVPSPNEKLEVIVHIHGGAYMYGSGHDYTHPVYLMDHDVIFVTFNYRLGILGFLSTEDDVVPGNNGLKDQVLALKWVQKNIASFGGNPDSVTLTGLSAGGSSVHFHYFSELSKDLFHRGFSQSGFALNPWSIQDEPLKKAKTLAEAVGCPTSCTKGLVQCLKQKPYKHLLEQMDLFFTYKSIPYCPFAPVVEKGSNPFLKDNPYVLLTKGQVLDVPWIGSVTAHEGYLPFTYFEVEIGVVNERWDELAPVLLDFSLTLPQSSWKTASDRIRNYYLQDQNMSEDNLEQVAKVFSDRLFFEGAETSVKEQAKVVKSPVYFYSFNYPGDLESKIVNHGIDARYFFGDRFTGKELTANELKMKDTLLGMLVTYAKTGKPKVTGVNWVPTGHEELTYLSFEGTEDIQLKTVKEFVPKELWRSLGFKENENLVSVKEEL